MTIAHFLIANPTSPEQGAFNTEFLESECQALAGVAGVERLDRYDTAEFDDPMTDDGQGPLLTIQTLYRDIASLEKGLQGKAFRDLVAALRDGSELRLSHDAMEMMFFPVGDDEKPGEWLAPLSYVVRYHRPSKDPEAFVNFYITHHPQIERRFPGIRSIMCYVPISWQDSTDIEQENYLLGNEVVFDSTEALAGALTSPVIKDMKADGANFPHFDHNTHFAMHRRRIG